MTDGVDDDLGLRHFVEDHVRVGQGGHAPDGWIVRVGANAGMQQQKVDNCLDAGLNAARALR